MKIGSIAIASMSCLIGCAFVTPPPNIRPQEANVVSLAPQNWYIYYSAGLPPSPNAESEGAWSFDIPSSQTGGHVNYVQTPFNVATTPHDVSATFRVESNAPQYEVLDSSDILPATIHIFFEQQGDDLVNPNGRWWAQAGGYNLGSHENQTVTFSVSFTADQWTNVDGQFSPQEFPAALQNIGWIGLSFGGQYFWGHGVALGSGNAKFVLIDFQVK